MKKVNPTLKRNIRQNDNTKDLSMDFTLDGKVWKTVEPEEAGRAMAGRRTRSGSISAAELGGPVQGDNMEEEDAAQRRKINRSSLKKKMTKTAT